MCWIKIENVCWYGLLGVKFLLYISVRKKCDLILLQNEQEDAHVLTIAELMVLKELANSKRPRKFTCFVVRKIYSCKRQNMVSPYY